MFHPKPFEVALAVESADGMRRGMDSRTYEMMCVCQHQVGLRRVVGSVFLFTVALDRRRMCCHACNICDWCCNNQPARGT